MVSRFLILSMSLSPYFHKKWYSIDNISKRNKNNFYKFLSSFIFFDKYDKRYYSQGFCIFYKSRKLNKINNARQ